jgi:hypothetical protein
VSATKSAVQATTIAGVGRCLRNRVIEGLLASKDAESHQFAHP